METVEHAGTATLKTLYMLNTNMKIPKHPKFYEEIRIRAREAQRSKQQATSTKPQASSTKPQAASTKPQAASTKPQAASHKQQAPSNKPQAPSPKSKNFFISL